LNSIVHLEKTDYHLPSVLQVGLNGIAAANLQTGILAVPKREIKKHVW